MSILVPNRFPSINTHYRLAVIGEAPGVHEEHARRPFVGPSGKFLAALLSRAGISIDACFLGNICQYKPQGNDISTLDWNGEEITDGLMQLNTDLLQYQPHMVLLLGNTALKAGKDPHDPHPLLPKFFKYKTTNWRGSLFLAVGGPLDGYKCLASYHPAYVLRDYTVAPLLQFDIRKAVGESLSPTLVLPSRIMSTTLSANEVCDRLYSLKECTKVGTDIEGYVDAMSCISFAEDDKRAFIVAFARKDGSSYWITLEEEKKVWKALAWALESTAIPKVLQNSLYDRFVLQYSYGIVVRNVIDDTMLKHWELYSDLAKSVESGSSADKRKRGLNLALQASLYTNEPYYKTDRSSQDDTTFYEYCCRDSCVTHEINTVLDRHLSGVSLDHYRLNVTLLNPLLYMELRGIRYDTHTAAARRDVLLHKAFATQARLNGLTGRFFDGKELFKKAREVLCKKRAFPTCFDDLPLYAYKPALANAYRFVELVNEQSPSLDTLGEIEDILGISLNTESPKQMNEFLYSELGLPTQYNDNDPPTPTSDYEALLKLSKICQQNDDSTKHTILQMVIELRSLRTRAGMLSISADRDGRIRCGYNLVGSDTGRITSYASPTGSGYNLQTIPNYTKEKEAPGGVLGDRDLFLADTGSYFFQCDLKGADGWTVAAYSAMLGDSAMLDDYRAGVTPFERLTLKLMGVSIPEDREELKTLCKVKIDKDGWERFACKRVQHGGCYLEGGQAVSNNILKDSEGKMFLPVAECKSLLAYWFDLYPGIRKWHQWIGSRLKERPVLIAASGQVRQFFGRPDEILTKAVAFEPQANTTYATNLAMRNLWSDPENHRVEIINPTTPSDDPDNRKVFLRIEPLHQVHDALCGQFKQEDLPWATPRIRGYFNNPITIAGQVITIPFDGSYGKSWGSLKEGKI